MASEPLTEGLRETIEVFGEPGEPRTTPEVANRLNVGRRSTYNRLERLAEQGRLETKKVGANARVWWRPPTDANPETPTDPVAADSLVDDVLDSAEVGVFVLDENFDVVWINEATERYFGLDREEVLGEDKRQLVGEQLLSVVDDSESFAQMVLSSYETNTYAQRFECHVTAGEDREERWLEHRSRPIESGAYAGGRVELYYDVTDRERSERVRPDLREEFESVVRSVEAYAIFMLDPDGHVRTWNPGAEQITGYAADEIRGEHVSTLFTEADRQADVPDTILTAALEEGSVEDEGWRVRADGSRFWANDTLTALYDDSGDHQGYAKVTRDVTERRRAAVEQQLLSETTRSIAESDTFQAGLRAALQDICEVTDWEYAEAWLPTDDGNLRRVQADYHVDDLDEFAAFSEGFTVARGEALPGQVWESGTVEWTADLSTESQTAFPRRDEMLEVGLQSSVGVPVVANDDVVAVLTFFLRGPRETDERLVDLVTSVASELGILVARRRTQKRLESERELVESVFETAPVGIAVFGPDREMIRANGRMEDLPSSSTDDATTYTAGEVTLLDESGDPLRPEEFPAIRAFETGRQIIDEEVQVPRPDGTTRWLSVNATPVTDANGDVTRVIATTTDVTRLKAQTQRLERRRDELETELDDIFGRIDDAFYALDDNMQFEYVNDRAEELLGHSEGELLGKNVWDALRVPDDDPIRERYQTAMETQEPTTFERFSEPLDLWAKVRVYPSESGLSVYFTDITELKERERALKESERRYRTLVENFPNGAVALFDEELTYLTAGGEVYDSMGVSMDDLRGERVTDHLPTELRTIIEPRYRGVFEGEASEFELELEGEIRDFRVLPVYDEDGTVFAGLSMSQDVTRQRERQRELKRQREQLAALVDVNDIVRDITDEVIEQSTREEIETTVCERLAESYKFAWIAEVNPETKSLDPHVEAGVDSYLEEIPISMAADEPSGQGPSGKAVRTGEIQTTQNAMTDPDFEPWREHAKEYGYRSSAAIPIVHDGTLYGLIGVYADRRQAFENQEKAVIGQLGEVVGHAIAAIERKQALTADEVTELEFTIPDVTGGIDTEIDGRISFDQAISTGDGDYLAFGTVDESAIDGLETLVDRLTHFQEVRIDDRAGDTARFELRLSEASIMSTVTSHGGYVQRATIEDGDSRLTIHLPVAVRARRIIEAITETYPTATLIRRQQIRRSGDTLARVQQTVAADLTDRQRTILEAAYRAGFFEWPRDATGEEVAESLGIAQSTFSQHLRRGQKQVFELLFSTTRPV